MVNPTRPPGRKWAKPCTEGRAEDLAWMVETGECASGAAKRLGITYTALEKWCNRNDPAIWRALVAREPRALDERHPGVNQWSHV